MYITFYNVSDPPNKLIKDITSIIGSARALAPTGQIDTLNPTIVVAWDSTNGDKIINANYAYIDTFNRYYWITTAIDTANRIVVQGKVDYLMSYAEDIKKCPCTVVRSEKAGINYTVDSKLPIDPNKYRVGALHSPNAIEDALNDKPYILILNAGVNS